MRQQVSGIRICGDTSASGTLVYLHLVFWLRGALAAGEGEVGFGVVCALAAGLDDRESEGEAAGEREHRGENASGAGLPAEEQGHRREYAPDEGAADEERGDLSGEERLAPPAHA